MAKKMGLEASEQAELRDLEKYVDSDKVLQQIEENTPELSKARGPLLTWVLGVRCQD